MSILYRLVLAFSFFFILALSLMFYFSRQLEKELVDAIEADLQNVLRSVHFSSDKLTNAKSADREALLEFIDEAKKNKGVKDISVISSNAEVVASSDPKKLGKKEKLIGKEMVVREQFGLSDSSGRHSRYDVKIPIMRDQKVIGLIETSIILNDFDTLLNQLYAKNLKSAGIIFLALFLSSFFVVYRLIRPLNLLSNAATRIASGELNIQLPRGGNDEIGKLTAAFNDMGRKLLEQKTLEEKLREVERRTVLSETAAIMAHEVRNPLNLINLTADHLAHQFKPAENPARETYLALIENLKAQVRQLNQMVSEFLTIGKPLQIKKTSVVLSGLIGQVEMLLKQQLVARSVTLQLSIPPDFHISADAGQMQLVFLNLLLNALEVSPEGAPIAINAGQTEQGNRILITDRGPGITAEDSEKVFEPYFSKRTGGTGLGLTLVKRIIEAHGGRVRSLLRSETGACFEIILPD